MAKTKLVVSLKKGTHVVVPLTAAEEAKQDADNARWLVDEQARVAAEEAVEAKAASGKQKLKDLGLDDEEIKALTGK